ncbi:hypothetical protein FRC02_002414 [Tulasnella sp. 418]|nr:hypothetical protein FRC02_002414 [Tulasnella sp. 418]
MYRAAQRKHAIQSFDSLLRVLIVYSYLVDPVFLRLITRFIVQLQLSNPKELDPTASLRFYLACLALVHIGAVVRHLFGPVEVDSASITLVLDFIGRNIPAAPTHIAILDVSIFIMQAIMLILAYETHDYRPDSADPLAPAHLLERQGMGTDNVDEDEYAPLATSSSSESPSHRSDLPVFHLRLNTTIARIRKPPEPSSNSDSLNPSVNLDRSASDFTTPTRLMGRAFRDLVQGRGGSGISVVAANLPQGNRSTSEDRARRIPGSLPSSSSG